jgi:hypothetical protein
VRPTKRDHKKDQTTTTNTTTTTTDRIMNRLALFQFLLLAVVSTPTLVESELIPLTIVGAEGTIAAADLPLGKCQGDCNRNTDCDANLLCFSRGGATTIPGCSGRAELDGTDYCWDPTDKPVEGVVAHIGNNGNPAVLYPLPRCTGQCRNTTDCQSGLVCLTREKRDDPVYGCTGDLLDRIDYCVNPGDIPGSTVGTPTIPTTTNTTDAETTTTTDGGLGVDGTDGGEDEDVEPLMGLLTIMYLGGADDPTSVTPLAECHGHCGLDVPCADGLTCYNRTTDSNNATDSSSNRTDSSNNVTVPGCGGILLPNIHYCVRDVKAAPLDGVELLGHPSLVGQLAVAIYKGFPYESLPLQHCQGDCQSHDMCDQNATKTTAGEPMSCYVRADGTGDVPGCDGIAVNDLAYCVKTADLAIPTASNNGNNGGGNKDDKSAGSIISFWWTLGAIMPALAASAMVCVE